MLNTSGGENDTTVGDALVQLADAFYLISMGYDPKERIPVGLAWRFTQYGYKGASHALMVAISSCLGQVWLLQIHWQQCACKCKYIHAGPLRQCSQLDVALSFSLLFTGRSCTAHTVACHAIPCFLS